MSIGRTESARRPLTVEDLAGMPDDGRRYELVDGQLDVSPSPTPIHNLVQTHLAAHLVNTAPKDCVVLSNQGVVFDSECKHYRIPDVAVFRREDIWHRHIIRPPLLAVEVVSPESIKRDHHIKTQEYAEFGIESYWIITPDIDDPVIVELRLDKGEYRVMGQALGQEVFETDVPFPVSFAPDWLVADVPWRDHFDGA